MKVVRLQTWVGYHSALGLVGEWCREKTEGAVCFAERLVQMGMEERNEGKR